MHAALAKSRGRGGGKASGGGGGGGGGRAAGGSRAGSAAPADQPPAAASAATIAAQRALLEDGGRGLSDETVGRLAAVQAAQASGLSRSAAGSLLGSGGGSGSGSGEGDAGGAQLQPAAEGCCLICGDQLLTNSIMPCGHSDICAMCQARVRIISANRRCPLCKEDNEHVVVTWWWCRRRSTACARATGAASTRTLASMAA